MILQQFIKAVAKGWRTILVITLIATAASLYVSISTTPKYRSQASFIISPSKELASSRDVVSAFTALDTLNIFATYADILVSDRVYAEAIKTVELVHTDLEAYSRNTEMNPESIILILSVEGPDPQIVARVANEIGNYGIRFINAYYSVFEIGFLDQAVPAQAPFMPQTFRDAGIFAAIGLLCGLLVVSVREFARTPIGDFLHKLSLDNESSAYTKDYLEKMLLNMKAADTSWPISFILISSKNLRDVYRVLPSFSRKKIMTEIFRRLEGQLKGNDLIGRWDEFTFAVVLPMTPKKAVGAIEDRLLQSLQPPISYGVEDSDQVELSPIAVSGISENIKDFDTFITKTEESLRDEEW